MQIVVLLLPLPVAEEDWIIFRWFISLEQRAVWLHSPFQDWGYSSFTRFHAVVVNDVMFQTLVLVLALSIVPW